MAHVKNENGRRKKQREITTATNDSDVIRNVHCQQSEETLRQRYISRGRRLEVYGRDDPRSL